jgi:phage-related protein
MINALEEARGRIKACADLPLYGFMDGPALINRLESEIEKLAADWQRIVRGVKYGGAFVPGCLRGVLLSDLALDSIPRLREEPLMLLLRVLYRIFKKRTTGRYKAQKTIGEILRELDNRKGIKQNTMSRALYELYFDSSSVNLDTLRKKTYKRGRRDFYDRLADHIYAACQEAQERSHFASHVPISSRPSTA